MVFDPLRFLLDLMAFYSIYLLLSVSLNLEFGYTGIPNFGKVLFFAGGGFVVGGLATRLGLVLAGMGVPDVDRFRIYNVRLGTMVSRFLARDPYSALLIFVSLLVLAVLVSAALGFLASYPAIRLREDYLGMTLVVSGELVRNIGKNYAPLICGTLGVFVPDPFASLRGLARDVGKVAVMMALALATWYLVERLVNSPFGRLLRAIRDNELAASAMGKDVVRVRMVVLMIGSAIAGLAGALYAFYSGSVHADDYMPIRTFLVWVMVIIGGAGNNLGAALGALVYVTVEKLIMIFKHSIPAPFDINYLSYIILGVILILTLMFRPEGLLPEKPGGPVRLLRRRVEPPG